MITEARSISRLTHTLLRRKKTDGFAPFILVLGSDASPLPMDIIHTEALKSYGLLDDQISQLSAVEKENEFKQIWDELDKNSKFDCLSYGLQNQIKTLEYRKKIEGYIGLAQLIKYGYFDIILTTNVDPALENALVDVGLARQDFSVLINGVDDPQYIQESLSYKIPRIKIIKLHGDLYTRAIAFSYTEIFQFSQKIETLIKRYLSQPVLMVGKTELDADINRCFPAEGDNFYYVNREAPKPGTSIYDAIQVRKNKSIEITGESAEFHTFFLNLSQKLLSLEEISEIVVNIGEISEDAVRSDEPLVEILEEGRTSTPQPTSKEPLVEILPSEDTSQPENTHIQLLDDPTILSIALDSNQRLTFTLKGPRVSYHSDAAGVLTIDPEDLNLYLQDMGRNLLTYHRLKDEEGLLAWRRTAYREGKRLYDDLIAKSPDLKGKSELARQAAGTDENLTLCFVGPRYSLGMPYELLYEHQPWADRHPICRQITGVTTQKSQPFATFLGELIRDKKPLRVLMIASGTTGITPDEEIYFLSQSIHKKAGLIGLKVEIESIPTESASLEQVQQQLKHCKAHIIHYAGHSQFEGRTGEESYLSFWQRPKNRSGDYNKLSARAIAQLLRDSDTMLVYFSSCVGATVGASHLLHSQDYLGLMDAVIQAGVPNVLGYRWYVTDKGARNFATTFYDSLLETRSLPRAVLHGRQKIYRENASDETWMSPILVTQNL